MSGSCALDMATLHHDEMNLQQHDTERKEHTFRKRRLTCANNSINQAAAAVIAASSESSDDTNTTATEGLVSSPSCDLQTNIIVIKDQECENLKTRTFRKRRLTFSEQQIATLASEINSQDDDEQEQEQEEPNKQNYNTTATNTTEKYDKGSETECPSDDKEANPATRQNDDNNVAPSVQQEQNHDETNQSNSFKKRRLQQQQQKDQCTDKNHSDNKQTRRLQSRVVHAGEIMKHPPSFADTEIVSKNRLYQGPYNLGNFQTDEEKSKQPVWKHRMTRRHSEDESKLPFLRSIVGQYSCHGIEPIYQEDEEEVFLNGDHQQQQETDLNPDAGLWAQLTQVEPKTSAKINQDRGGIAFPYGNCAKTALFAVYDGHGHGGELVSQFALHHIQRRLENHPHFITNVEKAFKEVFSAVDEALEHEPSVEPYYAGTTACVVLLRDKSLTISNAGDSRAVLARRIGNTTAYKTIPLSDDQKPDLPLEQARIEAAGGFVSPPPEPGLSARVWLDPQHSQIGLAMARSIGDYAVKNVGVISEPVVTSHTLEPTDELLILASDGVWEFISSEEAVAIVADHIDTLGATGACQVLIEAAANRWHAEEGDYRDDITALVVQLQKLWDNNNSTSK